MQPEAITKPTQSAQLAEIDQLSRLGRRWKLITAGVIFFASVATLINIAGVPPHGLIGIIGVITTLLSIGLILNVQLQLRAWSRHTQVFIKTTQKQATHIQSHEMLLSGIDIIVGATEKLQAAATVDDMCRIAIELTRNQLGVERCGIFLFNPETPEKVIGTYGTDMAGRTTDEHTLALPFSTLLPSITSVRRGIDAAWHYRPQVDLYDTERIKIGVTWHVDTPIFGAGNTLIGVFCNDKAISKDICNHDEQKLIAAFCASFGALIDQKRASDRETQFAQGLTAIFAIAEELLAAQSEDEIWRMAVERTRERLGAQRCALFWLDTATKEWVGTYGTDFNGQTTLEHDYRFHRNNMLAYEKNTVGQRWFVEQTGPYVDYQDPQSFYQNDVGWIVHTPIFINGTNATAILFNDSAITRGPVNGRQQDLIAVFCSTLGSIVARKRLESSLQENNLKLEQRVQLRTQQLSRRAESERLVAEIASQFMRADAIQISQNIQYAMSRTAKFLEVQVSKVFFLAADGYMLDEAFEWRANGIAPDDRPKVSQPFYQRYPWWHRQLLDDTVIQIVQLDQLPPEMASFVEGTRRQDIRSMVSVPLMRGKTLIGEMEFDAVGQERQWTREDITLIRLVAETISGAMERVRITKALQTERDLLEMRVAERTRELTTLLEMSQSLSAAQDMNSLLERAMNSLRQLLQYNYMLVWEKLENNEMRLVNVDEPEIDHTLQDTKWCYQEDIDLHWKTVLEQRRPVIIADVNEASDYAEAYRAQTTRILGHVPKTIQAILFVPILSHGRVLGMIAVGNPVPKSFQERHAQLVMALAHQIGIAIDNARMHTQQVKSAAMGERNRLARELHDSVSQALFGIVLGARTLKQHLGVSKREYADAIEYLLKLSEVSLAEMRALIFELRPESLEKFGLIEAFRKQATELCNRHNLKLDIKADDQDPALPLAVKEAVYRVGMEALQNTIKHAQANLVSVRLQSTTTHVLIEVTDDGTGFNQQTNYVGHLGLHTMQERATEFGGTVQVRSAIGTGTVVQGNFPINMVKSAFH